MMIISAAAAATHRKSSLIVEQRIIRTYTARTTSVAQLDLLCANIVIVPHMHHIEDDPSSWLERSERSELSDQP
jgi:hypothetical protein